MSDDSSGLDLQWIEKGEDHLTLLVDRNIYPEEVIFRTCYLFTDRCYLFLEPASDSRIKVRFRKRRQSVALERVVGDFGNELINQRVRHTIAVETRAIRELIVTQAFAEASFDGT
jgi:His-Xaa-Ser system protein HxsD